GQRGGCQRGELGRVGGGSPGRVGRSVYANLLSATSTPLLANRVRQREPRNGRDHASRVDALATHLAAHLAATHFAATHLDTPQSTALDHDAREAVGANGAAVRLDEAPGWLGIHLVERH